jgi:hypothetical protein
MKLLFFLALTCLPNFASERFLLAAGHQVIEVDRSGKVTEILRYPGHTLIYDAWRLPGGGIAYAHRRGLALFDKAGKLILDHASVQGPTGQEADGITVLENGNQFALLDTGAGEIRVVSRGGTVLSQTPLPGLGGDPLHSRYRVVRQSRAGNAFWVSQFSRRKVLRIERGTGKILNSISLDPHLDPPASAHKSFAILDPGDGTLLITSATGKQILRFNADGEFHSSWNAAQLGISCASTLGVQSLPNKNLLLACGDYHIDSPAAARDVLVEINTAGTVVWRLTHDQLASQIEGTKDSKTGHEHLHVANVHFYDTDDPAGVLAVFR